MNHAVLYTGFAVTVWLLLVGLYGMVTSRNLVHLCLSLTVVQAATYVLLSVIGYRTGRPAGIFTDSISPGTLTVDPLVAALMLTDVVVEATVVALLLTITVKIHKRTGSTDPDHVNVMRG